MGHLLSTVNPQAAADIKPTIPDDLPGIGSAVTYYPRSGEGRSNKRQAPALVAHKNEDGSLALIVMWAADDFLDVLRAFRKSEDNQTACWDFPDGGYESEPTRLNMLTARVADLEKEFKRLFSIVLGDWAKPEKSVIDILADFEARLAALGKAIKKG